MPAESEPRLTNTDQVLGRRRARAAQFRPNLARTRPNAACDWLSSARGRPKLGRSRPELIRHAHEIWPDAQGNPGRPIYSTLPDDRSKLASFRSPGWPTSCRSCAKVSLSRGKHGLSRAKLTELGPHVVDGGQTLPEFCRFRSTLGRRICRSPEDQVRPTPWLKAGCSIDEKKLELDDCSASTMRFRIQKSTLEHQRMRERKRCSLG